MLHEIIRWILALILLEAAIGMGVMLVWLCAEFWND